MNIKEDLVYNPKHAYTSDVPLDQMVDETDANCVYVGWADIGSSLASAVWRIKRIKIATSITSIGWAGSSDSFKQIWNNRASLSYSQGG